jgi:hypothetical protein
LRDAAVVRERLVRLGAAFDSPFADADAALAGAAVFPVEEDFGAFSASADAA